MVTLPTFAGALLNHNHENSEHFGDMGKSSAMSRSGLTNPLGKMTVSVPAFKVSEETYDGLQALAAKAGVPVAEFVRKLVEVRVHGEDVVARLETERLRVITGK